MSSSPSSSSSSEHVHSTTLTPHDVLSGRGPRIQNHPGNRLFRTIVASRRHDYANAGRHRDKQIIAMQLVDYVRGNCGMRYTLGDGRKVSDGGKRMGEVVEAVEGMEGGLDPPGRFLELVVVEGKDKKGGGGGSSGSKKKRGGGGGGGGDAVIVAHPDLWRPVDDDAACEKVKQAFRNLSKGLISDPRVKSEYGSAAAAASGTGSPKASKGGGRGGSKKKSGRRRRSSSAAAVSSVGTVSDSEDVTNDSDRQLLMMVNQGDNTRSSSEVMGESAGVGAIGGAMGGGSTLIGIPMDDNNGVSAAIYPPMASAAPHGGLSSLDMNLDDFDDFGTIEELAQSLELLESSAGGNGSNTGGDDVAVQQHQSQQQVVPAVAHAAHIAHVEADFEPNPIAYPSAAPAPSSLAAVPAPAVPVPVPVPVPAPAAPPPPVSSASGPISTATSSSSLSLTDPVLILKSLQTCLELALRVKTIHAAGRTLWIPTTSANGNGNNHIDPLVNDLVKLGEAIYKAFAGVEPVRTSGGQQQQLTNGDAAEEEEDHGTLRSKRRSRGASASDDFRTGPQYVPLRDVGFPTSLCTCVGSLLDAADPSCSGRYTSIDEVEADLRLMLAKPDRYLFDPPAPFSAGGTGYGSNLIPIKSSGEGRLSFPTNRLYGRDQHLAELLHIFQHVIVEGGQREFVRLTGFAGTGKTALIEQLREPLAAKGGNFVTAKFDKLGHVQPMQVIFNAFDTYCMAISGVGGCSRKTPEIPNIPCYCRVREAVQAALGTNGTVLTDLMPNLRHVLGEELSEARAVEVGGVEALNRFIYFFRLFVRAISSLSSPIIFFLDDLQWADSAALELIATLASDAEVKSLLFIAAYREEEVAADHRINTELARLHSSGIRINDMSLGNISGGDLNAFISDVLLLSPRITRSLADLVHAKTTGNILFVIELLRSLNEEGLLRYSARNRRWEWDVEAIQARSVDDNVVGLLTKKMLNLDNKVQWMLKVASCLGSQIESSILTQLLLSEEQDKAGVEGTLQIVVREGLMTKVGSIYRFSHDKVEQAAYSLIAADERQALHLSIGRTLWGYGSAGDLGDRLEVIVNQLSRGSTLITDPNERIRVAQLCLTAGKKAVVSSAFLLASTYLVQGTVLLNEQSWKDHYDLSLELHSSCAEAQYATGNHLGISISVNPIMNNGRNLQDKMRAYYTLLNSLGAKGQQTDAISCGMGLLSALGETFPTVPDKNDATAEFEKTQAILKNLKIDEIPSAKVISDTQKYAAVKALFILVRHAHMVNQMLMSIMICRIVQLSVIYGVSKESSFAFATYGFLLSKYVGIDEACEFGKIALSLLERFNAKDVLARVTCVLNDFLIFKEPLQSRLPSLKNAYEIGLQMGDIEWALTDANIYVVTAIQSGRKLTPLEDELKEIIQQMRLYKHHTLMVALLYNRVIMNLMEETNDPTDLSLDGDEFSSISQEVKRINIVNRSYFFRLWLAYLFGKYELAAEMAERRWELTKSRPFRSSSLANETLYTGLIAVMMAKKEGPADVKWKGIALAGKRELQKWVGHSAWNFQHKHRLLEAEIAYYLNGDIEGAAKAYEDAIQTAKRHSFLSEMALSYERAAMFYDEIGNPSKAIEYFKLAHQGYTEWGATQKARQIYDKTIT